MKQQMVMSLNVQSQETKSMKSDHFENTVRVRFHLLALMANESSCRLLCFSKVCLSRHLVTLICHLTFSFFPLRRSNRNYFDTLDATTAKTAPLSTIKVIMIQLILAILSFLSPRSHLCPPPLEVRHPLSSVTVCRHGVLQFTVYREHTHTANNFQDVWLAKIRDSD